MTDTDWQRTDSGLVVRGYRRDHLQVDPPLDWAAYRSTALRAPKNPLIEIPQTLTEVTGPLLGPGRLGELDHDLTRQHDGRAAWASGSSSAAACSTATAGRSPTRSSRSGRPTPPGATAHDGDRTPAPLDPNFTGVGPLRDRRRGPLPVRHDQAGRLPVGQPPQRLAAGAHPLLAVRAGVRPAPGHPDVLPGRSALPLGPDLQLRPRPEGARADDRRASTWHDDRARRGRSATSWDIVLRGRDETPFEEPH